MVGQTEVCDHWYIGSDGMGPNPPDSSGDVSEGIGSTACLINAKANEVEFFDEVELCFSSRHPGGTQLAFADGHARFIRETIDREVFSALGTRGGGETSSEIE